MAGTIQSTVGVFDPTVRDKLSAAAVINLAVNGATKKPRETDANQRKRIVTAQNELLDRPDFVVNARTDASETFAVLELIAKGVTFPAGFFRVIEVDCYVSGNAADETGFLRATGSISGGTTPIVRVTTVQGPSAVAGAGLAATPAVTFTAGSGTLTISVTSAEAEVLNWVCQVKVGRLQTLVLGV